MQESLCFVCESKSQISATSPNSDRIVECPRCGTFMLTEEVMRILQVDQKNLNRTIVSNLSGWIRENQNLESPRINKDFLVKMKKKERLNIHEKAYKLLKWLDQQTESPGQMIKLSEFIDSINLLSICYAFSKEELLYLVGYLERRGYINVDGQLTTINPKGFSYLDEYNKNPNSNMGFCAMWFDETLKFLGDTAIEPAIKAAGYEAKIINKHPHNSAIVDEIMALIRRSKFLIADLTGNSNGVYFEAGFAIGLGIPVMFTCEQDYFNKNKVHFDVQHFHITFWEKDKLVNFKENLAYRIERTLGRGFSNF